MNRTAHIKTGGWGSRVPHRTSGAAAADTLLRVVDAGLLGVICVAPFFFGGRHDLGRLVLVLLIALAGTAWFARQALAPTARWPRTMAHVIILLAASLLLLQIVPLPQQWLARLSPKTAELLPLWTGDGIQNAFGAWQTLSLLPHETTKSLVMLLSYGLLFIVVAGRIESIDDVQRIMIWVAVAVVSMAAFGLAHYFTSDGRFFWFFAHPHRQATNLSGAFVNRNHFASFLVLGVGPLVALLLGVISELPAAAARQKQAISAHQIALWGSGAALTIVTLAILGSCSRGGVLMLLVAGAVLTAIYWSRRIVDSRFLYGLCGLAVVVIGLLSLHGYDKVTERLDDFTEGSIDELDQHGVRRQLWAANVAAFKDFWLTGTGAGSHSRMYPLYLPESYNKIYTHAENGYLQIASEAGIGGLVLLVAGVAVGGAWCATCLRHARRANEVRLFGAAAAGLAASLAHSVVDFVWYIPACMSVTVVLAACLLRLSQLVQPSETRAAGCCVLPRGRWVERGAAALLIGTWSIYVFVGPGVAAVHWDRYLRASVANSKLARHQMVQLVGGQIAPSLADCEPLNEAMVRHLKRCVEWDPQFARAHLRLADKYVLQFELSRPKAANAMGLAQVRDAAMAAGFASPAELHAWLDRAFGADVGWLRQAAAEARHAAALSPLDGEAYTLLADLCFLDGTDAAVAQSYVEQALRVRPYDAAVRYAVGELARRRGDIRAAIDEWSKCFGDSGPHQLRIVFWLAGGMPVEDFLSTFQPDWRTLRHVWSRYREFGQPNDIELLLAYTKEVTLRQTQDSPNAAAARIWYLQSSLFAEVGKHEAALACLEQAYARDTTNHAVRQALAAALQAAGRFAEAEAHLRWCLARRPADKGLTNALVQVTKQRLAQREPIQSALPTQVQRAASNP